MLKVEVATLQQQKQDLEAVVSAQNSSVDATRKAKLRLHVWQQMIGLTSTWHLPLRTRRHLQSTINPMLCLSMLHLEKMLYDSNNILKTTQ